MKENSDSIENIYQSLRPQLIAICFRMLGSLAEAEEIVQDSFVEFQKADRSEIKSAKAWLIRVCSNKAINLLKSAYKNRESYTGPWLPDEIPEGLAPWHERESASSQEHKIILAESLTTSFLLILETLTPEQRAVYLLNEIFDYSFKEVADFLNKEVAACRKIGQRARDAIEKKKRRFSDPPTEARETILKLYEFATNGDREGIKSILSDECELWGDGGGKVFSSGLVTDLESAIDFFEKLGASEAFQSNKYRLVFSQVNSRPGVVVSRKTDSEKWIIDTVISYEFDQDQIVRVYVQRNPDKLSSLLNA